MQRTIAEAQAWVDGGVDSFNNEQLTRYRNEIQTATAQATKRAETYVNELAANLVAKRDGILEHVCELRDSYQALIKDGELGLLTAAEFQERYDQLEAQKREAINSEAPMLEEIETISDIEDEPSSWYDNLITRTGGSLYREMAYEFSF